MDDQDTTNQNTDQASQEEVNLGATTNEEEQTIDDRQVEDSTLKMEDSKIENADPSSTIDPQDSTLNPPSSTSNEPTPGRWYVVHTYSGHENKVATQLKQRVESEHLENKIFDVLVPTQDKIEIRGGKKASVKEKIFPGYILVKMDLDDAAWLAVRTTQGVTSFVGIGNRPTPVPDHEVASIIQFMTQGAAPTFKDVFLVDDTVKIIDGPFADFIGKVESVDKEKGKVRVLVSIFGRETPVELDFLQVTKL